jgi:spermidine/putrescine transport system substrate-binding protein
MGAKHKKNAEKLMNFYYDPYNAAVLAAYVNYITPVMGAKEEAIKLDPALADNQLIFPNEEFLSLTQAFRGLDPKEDQIFSRAFAELTLGL